MRPGLPPVSPGWALALLLLLAVIGTASAVVTYDALSETTSLPFFAMLSALTVAAIAVPRDGAMRAVVGVLLITALAAALTSPVSRALWPEALPWLGIGLSVLAVACFLLGVWRMTGRLGDAGRVRRGVAVLAGLAIAIAGGEWSEIRPALAAELIVPSDDAGDLDQAYQRFRDLSVEDALIDQSDRIARRFAALSAHGTAPETFVLAVGGSGFQEIFDREARRAASVLAARNGGPSLVLSNSPDQVKEGLLASPRTVGLALAAIGRRASKGDTLLVYLSSHGGRDARIAMAAPRLDFVDLAATGLARDLARAGIRRRIVIVSACFGATWIKPLASPSTIVIAAAAVDRTSFGCDDSRELTVFGKAMLGELANRDQSLARAFARAKLRIAAEERVEGATPSLPQAWVGRDMIAEWSRPLSKRS